MQDFGCFRPFMSVSKPKNKAIRIKENAFTDNFISTLDTFGCVKVTSVF
jgi:hypothetical protein